MPSKQLGSIALTSNFKIDDNSLLTNCMQVKKYRLVLFYKSDFEI